MNESFWYAEASNGQTYGNHITFEDEERLGALELLSWNLHETLRALLTPELVFEHVILQEGSLNEYREIRT